MIAAAAIAWRTDRPGFIRDRFHRKWSLSLTRLLRMAIFSLLAASPVYATAPNGDFFAIGGLSHLRGSSEWRFFRHWWPLPPTRKLRMAIFSPLVASHAYAVALNGDFFAIGGLSHLRGCSEWRFFRHWRPLLPTRLLRMAIFSPLVAIHENQAPHGRSVV